MNIINYCKIRIPSTLCHFYHFIKFLVAFFGVPFIVIRCIFHAFIKFFLTVSAFLAINIIIINRSIQCHRIQIPPALFLNRMSR